MKHLLHHLIKLYLFFGFLAAFALAEANNPPAYQGCRDSCTGVWDTVGFRMDLLYWRSSVDQLALGSEETVTPIPSSGIITYVVDKSYVKRPGFNFNPGFRLGVNQICPCKGWNVALNWTHYHNKASLSGDSAGLGGLTVDSITMPTTQYTLFIPYWERAVGVIPDEVSGHWTFDVDFVDIELGYKYFVSSCTTLRPYLGLRGARVNQGFHVESSAYRTEASTTLIGPVSLYQSFVKARNEFLAIGPRIGCGLELDLGYGFSLVGEAAGSFLFGRARKNAYENFYGAVNGTAPVVPTAPFMYEGNGTRDGSLRVVSDLALGVKWNYCLYYCNQYYPLVVAVLWEHHGFYGFNQFEFNSNAYTVETASGASPFVGGTPNRQPNGDIFTQGLTVAVNVGF